MQVIKKCSALLALAMMVEGAGATNQVTDLLERLLKVDIQAAAGSSAKVLVPPGELYDPLVMHEKDGDVWLNDDGKVEGDKGSRMVAVDKKGQVKVLVDANAGQCLLRYRAGGFWCLRRPGFCAVAAQDWRTE